MVEQSKVKGRVRTLQSMAFINPDIKAIENSSSPPKAPPTPISFNLITEKLIVYRVAVPI